MNGDVRNGNNYPNTRYTTVANTVFEQENGDVLVKKKEGTLFSIVFYLISDSMHNFVEHVLYVYAGYFRLYFTMAV